MPEKKIDIYAKMFKAKSASNLGVNQMKKRLEGSVGKGIAFTRA